jgi:hypothetical protein
MLELPTYARDRKISTIFLDFPKISAAFLKFSAVDCEIFLDVVTDIKYRSEPGKPVLRRKSRSAVPVQQSQTSKPRRPAILFKLGVFTHEIIDQEHEFTGRLRICGYVLTFAPSGITSRSGAARQDNRQSNGSERSSGTRRYR